MKKSIHEWVQAFQDQEIPVLRQTEQNLADLSTHSDDLSPAQIAAVVYRDPLMTLRVLRFVNALPRGRLAGEVTTVEHSIMMLGITPFFDQFSNLSFIEDHLASNNFAFTGLMQVISRAHHAAYQAWIGQFSEMISRRKKFISARCFNLWGAGILVLRT